MAVHRLRDLHYHRFRALTGSVFHSELKTWLFGKSFPPYRPFLSYFPTGLIPPTLGPFNVSILLNGWMLY